MKHTEKGRKEKRGEKMWSGNRLARLLIFWGVAVVFFGSGALFKSKEETSSLRFVVFLFSFLFF